MAPCTRRLTLILALLAVSPLAGARPRPPLSPTDLDRALEPRAGADRLAGAQAAIVQDGQVVWTGAAGKAQIRRQRPVSARTMFSYASLSKTLVASLVLDRVESGELAARRPDQHLHRRTRFPARARSPSACC